MCGIAAVILADSLSSECVSTELYEALGILQHRGQDAAGIVTCGQKGRLYQCKGNGMVRDVFNKSQLEALRGWMGLSHVRYPTAGTSSNSEAQPFFVNSPYGIAFAHNGNLTNAQELHDFLDFEAHRHVNTDSDSELLLNIFANHLQKTGKFRVNEEDIFSALQGVYNQCRGGYACMGMIAGFGLFAFRDPNGIRPLIYGERKTSKGTDYMLSSESVALDALGFVNFVDVGPGEAIIITKDGLSKRQCCKPKEFTPCIFEYVYFARPDSVMDGVSVYRSRLAMGEALAKTVIRKFGQNKVDIDVVVPVPDTSRTAALQVATALNIVYREGFIKNRYIGRTFIMPGQSLRKKSVRRKLNPMPMEFNGKNVLIVDDSIVRGTTSREIVQMARESGAKKVYFASCAPPIKYPNVYGIDMPTRHELVAYNRTENEIAVEIGADEVIFQDLQDLVESVSQFNVNLKNFDVSVFNGCYITGDITNAYLKALADFRSEVAKDNRIKFVDTDVIGLHNSFQKE
ncbi:amidophosphoribosyltransferase [Clydaea vesicula]|uniref:Amidophosphoribosyltransferase n=1 Tax=Clydaea vesicula TaxID=447962 RepID=A0AAD5XZ98_9FUNG|nr:amidophosphoribosyltransferase [Clydaea vesicula]KAJ3397851.1 amidophosphoribosyltransferase [Lobulomyces angularis]